MKSVTQEFYAGIDVSSEWLDIASPDKKTFRTPNTEEGIRKVISQLPQGAAISMESSGAYERLAARMLKKAGFTVFVFNPYSTRQLSLARGKKAKTDALDAQNLAEAGKILPAPVVKTDDQMALASLSRHIQELKSDCSDMKRRLKAPDASEAVKSSLKKLIVSLTMEIESLEEEFEKQVKSSSLKTNYELLLSIPNFGKVTARLLVCEMTSDTAFLTRSKIASYAGLAPMDFSSGKREGLRRIRRGNSRLKAALYMPALQSIRRAAWAKDLYSRLRSRGRGHQCAIVAVMRKILTQAASVLRRGEPWTEKPPQRN